MDDDAGRDRLARELTDAFLDGSWKMERVAERGAGCLSGWPAWMNNLALRVVSVHRSAPVDRRYELFVLIATFLEEHHVTAAEGEEPELLSLRPRQSVSLWNAQRPPLRHNWPIAQLESVPRLAERLELSDGQLAWLADVRTLERTVSSERLRNYRYRSVARSGGVPRVIEAPKGRLKEVQRWILREILDKVPVHDAAHGFTRRRSAVTHAELHVGRAAILRLDLKDFFASVSAARVYGIWRTLGYSASVSHMLTGLTTNTVPETAWRVIAGNTPQDAIQARFDLGRQLATPHLPQGAPTSPALANLAAFRLDQRLTGLARASGLSYSRYADDLTFSGSPGLNRRRIRFESAAAAIIRTEGFSVNQAKSTFQSAGGRQTVCGVVVNTRTNVARPDFDQLKATLHNAAAHGPDSQNRDDLPDFKAHLRGRISWVESLNPGRGQKLRELFAEIDWPAGL